MLPTLNTASGAWHISLRFTLDAFRHGVDPFAILERLRALATRISIGTVDDRLPHLSLLQARSCHLGFEISLATEASRAQIDAVFADVRHDCIVRLFPPTRRAADLIALIQSLPQEGRLGDILVECGAISRAALDAALEQQGDGADTDARSLGQILVERKQVAPELLDAALAKQAHMRGREAVSTMAGVRAGLQDASQQAGRLASLLDEGDAAAAGAAAGQLARRLQALLASLPEAS